MNKVDEQTEAQVNRRALLKGAVGVGVGVAAYASPLVSNVPAYATHGLGSFSTQTSDICFGFSPNHESTWGDWHLPTAVANVFDPIHPGSSPTIDHSGHGLQNRSDQDIRVRFMVGGVWRTLAVSGHFNNWDGGGGGNYGVVGWNGGGIKMQLTDPNCELLIIGWFQGTSSAAQNCTTTAAGTMKSSFTPIHNGGTNPGTAPLDNVPNPWQGDPARWIYYHSGQPRKGGNWLSGVRFRIRCA